MSQTVLAAQLYTVRDFTKTRADFAESMRKISEIGYRLVQVSSIGAIDDADVKRICDDNGLTICNTHVGVDELQNDIEGVIALHELWNCRHVAIGGMPQEFRDSEDGFRTFAAIANGIGERLADAGLTFSYHNHSFEFIKYGGTQRPGHHVRRDGSALCAGGTGYLLDTARRRRSCRLD